MILKLFYDEIPANALKLDPIELAARLGTSHTYSNELIESCEARLRTVLQCRYSAALSTVDCLGDGKLDIGFGEFESKHLIKNFGGAKKAFIMAVTLGHGVDRLLCELESVSLAERFITDALASAFAESACDFAQQAITEGYCCRTRFSPGYGDLPLEIQRPLLDMLSAQKLLNITLNQSLFMSPVKSVTAIIGCDF